MAESDHPASPPTNRAFEGICAAIRSRIAAGELRAGDKLPPEREMAEHFGVGRNVVREALRSLEMAGVIRLQKGRLGGAFIRPASASRVTHAMHDLMDFGSIGWADLTEARSLVLDTVVRLACERATSEDLDALERNVDRTEELTDAGRFEERSNTAYEFYTVLAAATHNPTLVLLVTSMSELVRRLVSIARRNGGAPVANLVASRRRVLRHLRSQDAESAIAELRSYLLNVHALYNGRSASGAVSKPAPRRATGGGARKVAAS